MYSGKKSLEIGVVGLGQCGGNLAEEFYRRGYRAVAMNTSQTDLRGLQLPDDQKLYIGIGGKDGAGQDVGIGRECIERHGERIAEQCGRILKGCECLLVTAGLGGGTGSNAATAVSILRSLNKPVSVMVTLPRNLEGSITKVNAVNATNNLAKVEVNSIVLVDNQKIFNVLDRLSIGSFYRKANGAVVRIFDEINRLSRDDDFLPVRSFDSEDFRKLFYTRGVLIYGVAELVLEDFQSEDRLGRQLKVLWDSSGLLSEGFDYAQASMAGLILMAPRDTIQGSSAKAYESLYRSVKELTGEGGIYAGLFQIPDGEQPRLYTLLGGLPFPARMQDLLDQARQEGIALSQKILRELPMLDLGEIEGLDLFSSQGMQTPSPELEEPPYIQMGMEAEPVEEEEVESAEDILHALRSEKVPSGEEEEVVADRVPSPPATELEEIKVSEPPEVPSVRTANEEEQEEEIIETSPSVAKEREPAIDFSLGDIEKEGEKEKERGWTLGERAPSEIEILPSTEMGEEKERADTTEVPSKQTPEEEADREAPSASTSEGDHRKKVWL